MEQYKNYLIEVQPGSLMRVIKPIGRGTVSKQLRGAWLSVRDARKAIDLYGEDLRVEQEEDNGKAVRSRRIKQV